MWRCGSIYTLLALANLTRPRQTLLHPKTSFVHCLNVKQLDDVKFSLAVFCLFLLRYHWTLLSCLSLLHLWHRGSRLKVLGPRLKDLQTMPCNPRVRSRQPRVNIHLVLRNCSCRSCSTSAFCYFLSFFFLMPITQQLLPPPPRH